MYYFLSKVGGFWQKKKTEAITIYIFSIYPKCSMDGIAWPHYANKNKVYRKGKSMEIESRFIVAWG